MKCIPNIFYSQLKDEYHILDLYLPDNTENFRTLVFFHGGGLETGNKMDNEVIFKNLSEKGIAVISASYRLYPNAKYPEFIVDAAEVVNWAFNNMKQYGNCNKIFIGGSSAGAYLSMMLCFDKSYLGKHNIDSNHIAGYIFNSGQPTTHLNVLKYKGLDERKVIIDETAPFYYVGENKDAAPILILIAENDIPNRLEQNILLKSTLKNFGYSDDKVQLIILNGYVHCEYDNLIDSSGKYIFAELINEFILNS